MKTINRLLVLFAVIMIFVLSQSAKAQEKWRTITLGVNTNVNSQGKELYQFSTALDYELGSNYFISSWNALSLNKINNSYWMASQTTIDKRIGGLSLGLGYLYSNSSTGNNIVLSSVNNKLYFTAKVQYRIKL